MEQASGSTRAHPGQSASDWLKALLFTVAVLFLPPPAHSAGPDTTVQSFVPLDYNSTYYGVIGDPFVTYLNPTAATSTVWAIVGSGNLSSALYQTGACCTALLYMTNPVTITGPFNGNPYNTLELWPPGVADPAVVERFGAALSIQGYRIAVGSTEELTRFIATGWPGLPYWQNTDGGRVHLYLHNGTTFVHERTISHGAGSDLFGAALDLRRFTLLVGRPGATPGQADLFDPDTGALITTFTSPGSDDNYGETVALLGSVALVGASGSNTVYAYRDDGVGNWSAAGTLDSPGVGSEFGAAIKQLDGRILVGAPGLDKAYIFEDDGDASWPVVAELTGVAGSRFGTAVALAEDTAFVSATELPHNSGVSGWVGRYERAPDGSWPLVSDKMSRNPQDNDGFGRTLSASSALLGVTQDSVAQSPAEFYIFTSQARTWDSDGDGVSNYGDNCADEQNPNQEDFDGDLEGDACDADIDNDGLSNADESTAGSDPYDPDSDDDGLLDGEDPFPTSVDGDSDGHDDPDDNCPAEVNVGQENLDGDSYGDACDEDIDGDGLSNDDELAQGTDPYNEDTDGDLYHDMNDHLPLDPNDGWATKYRFNINAHRTLPGQDVILVREVDGEDLHSIALVGGAWIEVPAPVIPNPSQLELFDGGRLDNRFVVISDQDFYLLEWVPGTGWSVFGPGPWPSGFGTRVIAAVDGDLIVLHDTDSAETALFDITLTGPVLRETTLLVEEADQLSLAGDYLLAANHDYTVPEVSAYNLAAGYTKQYIGLPDPPEPGNSGELLKFGPVTVSADQAFVDGRYASHWMNLAAGSWSSTLTGLAKSEANLDHNSGGNGAVVVQELSDDETAGLELLRVVRVSNGSEIGLINLQPIGTPARYVTTNGKVVVQHDPVYSGSDTPYVDVFVVPPAVPPGC